MLIHCLTVRFKESATPQQIDAFHAALAALPDQIDLPVRTRHGRDLGERPSNAHYGLVNEFESADDFYSFLDHPAHRAVPRDAVESYESVQFLLEE
ncbi:Dabb family protein [Actinomadura madurae]|uniref:Dabb family protein n=1 Tax=Actinomadura madurae TaxID=1993 RepID=UPI0020267836|nr:Dabb family protein [Actinomadura madurae]MCP9950975.1 Dabb family protein [Actinomadura madurae]MCP9967761.1 Dabb family protein [Actinomadura madurae]MCP9980210.1 Dabb family protein [Actinomadura madurae]MCQ0008265.1 Dabb family protein [Actinomadura madurae]MCQ0016421.1 Dabb family protein [Actinomadura madurae]